MRKVAVFVENLAKVFFVVSLIYVFSVISVYAVFHDMVTDMTYAPNLIRKFGLSNPILMLIGVIVVVASVFVLDKIKNQIHVKNHSVVLLLAIILFFIVKVFVSLELLFLTEWDAGYMFGVANAIEAGEVRNDVYFSMFPFNIFLIWYDRICIKIGSVFNPNGIMPGLMTEVILNCLWVAITSYLVFDIIVKLTKSLRVAWVGWIVFVLFVGTSPWTCIPYTDSLTFIFPTLIFWLYLKFQDNRRPIWKWMLLAFVAYMGYRMKGPALLVFLSILLTELLELMKQKPESVKRVIGALCGMFAVILLLSKVCIPFLFEHSSIVYDKDHELGMEYVVMSGLSPWDHGTINAADYSLAESTDDKDERVSLMIQRIKERLNDYGFIGWVHHQSVKTDIIFNDGTFAWGQEGNFYRQLFPERDWFSPRLRNLFYSTGDNFIIYSTYAHFLWLTVLLFTIFAVFYKTSEKKYDRVMVVLIMSLAAEFTFAEMAEARARFLYTYAPLYVIAATLGVYALYRIWKKKEDESV